MTLFFFFNDTATTEIYTLSLHDALPILRTVLSSNFAQSTIQRSYGVVSPKELRLWARSEEHTSELQSRLHLVCRLLLEKKKIDSCARHQRRPRLANQLEHPLVNVLTSVM